MLLDMEKNKNLTLTILFILAVGCICTVSGQVSTEIKNGSYIIYAVTTSGAHQGPNLIAERMDFQNVQGNQFSANVTLIFDNGTISISTQSFNLQEGQVQGWSVIPANLGVGNSFHDASTGQDVTIQGEQQKFVATATRTVTYASDSQRIVQWDKSTGVFVSKVEIYPSYSVNTTAVATNLWSPDILGLEPNVFYGVVIGSVAFVVAAVVVVFLRSRKRRVLRKKVAQKQ
jgi:hypothetical protein